VGNPAYNKNLPSKKEKEMKIRILFSIIVLLAISASSFAGDITAEKILQNMVDSYERQMKDVKDVTVISEVTEGKGEEKSVSTEVNYRKMAKMGGKTVGKSREELNDGQDITIYDGEYKWEWHSGGEVTKKKVDYNPMLMEESLNKIKAEFVGTEKIDGDKTYILRIKNMVDIMDFPSEEGIELEKVNGKGWIDANDWVIRKMEIEMKSNMGTMKMIETYEDYRKVRGMFVSYRTLTKTSLELSPEMIKKQLQEVPSGYRKQAEAQIKTQMGKEQIRITKVKEVKVNTGLSDDLFDGSKLGK